MLKKVMIASSVFIVTSCAGVGTKDQEPSVDYSRYLAAQSKSIESVKGKVNGDAESAIVLFAATPAAPAGSVQPLGSLRVLYINTAPGEGKGEKAVLLDTQEGNQVKTAAVENNSGSDDAPSPARTGMSCGYIHKSEKKNSASGIWPAREK
jgi:hypothetical protein